MLVKLIQLIKGSGAKHTEKVVYLNPDMIVWATENDAAPISRTMLVMVDGHIINLKGNVDDIAKALGQGK